MVLMRNLLHGDQAHVDNESIWGILEKLLRVKLSMSTSSWNVCSNALSTISATFSLTKIYNKTVSALVDHFKLAQQLIEHQKEQDLLCYTFLILNVTQENNYVYLKFRVFSSLS